MHLSIRYPLRHPEFFSRLFPLTSILSSTQVKRRPFSVASSTKSALALYLH